ncbi:hypothetical protein D3C72_1599900 [compost metagenome]
MQFHLAPVGARRHGDAAVQRGVQRAHGIGRAWDLSQIAVQRLVAALAELVEPIRRDRGAGARLDQRQFVLDRLSGKNIHRLRMRDAPTQFVEHLGQHSAGDGFGVDQDAVAIEKHGVKGKISHCGQHRKGP